MKKITPSCNRLIITSCLSRMTMSVSFFCLLIVGLFSCQNVFSQIGSFPLVNTGFEIGTPAVLSSATVAIGTQLANWSYASASQNTVSLNATIVRSGAKSFDWATTSTSATLISPTSANGAILANTSYVIQYYYWKNNSGTARVLSTTMTADATANLGTAVLTSALGTSVASTAWSKVATVVTTKAGTSVYGFVQLKPSGGSFASYLFDDFCIYPGTAVDVTPPPSATSPVSSVSGASLNLSWTASSDVDGGGYVVVRYAAAPNADNDPNQNGIYTVGNTINNGTGSLVGTVVYSGTATSFVDTADGSVATYYYKIYAVDKAFNYSDEIQQTLGVNELSFLENTILVYKNRDALLVNSNVAIANVKVFDIQGRLITELENVNATNAVIKDLKEMKQVLIVKITSQDNKVISKKVVF